MALENTSKAELFNNFSPATDEEIALLAQEASLGGEQKPPIGRMDYLQMGPDVPPDGSFPMGSNTTPLVVNYRERQRYADAPYFARDELPVPLDSYYDKGLYGRVDRFQNVIVPREDSALYQQIKSSPGKTVYVMDIAGELFYELRRNLQIATDLGALPPTSLYSGLQATAAAFGYKKSYDAQLTFVLRQAFHRYLSALPKETQDKILTFRDYAMHFLGYVSGPAYDTSLAVTLSAHVISSHMSPRISGLCIEVAKEDFSADLVKWQKYMLDPGFSYYVRAARKYGFYVDRNAPWRLYLDLLSKPSREHLLPKLTAVSAGEAKRLAGAPSGAPFFDRYYVRTYTLDVPWLRNAMVQSYNAFVAANPQVIISTPGTVQCPTPRFTSGPRRGRTTLNQVVNLGHHYWCGLYYDLREAEQQVKYPGRRDALVKRATAIAHAYGERQAWIFINNLFKPYLYEDLLFKKGLTKPSTSVIVGAYTGGS
jgi:hypothetical protein